MTIAEIAAATGIHRKILSRLNNRPTSPVKGETLDVLAQFFFREYVICKKGFSPTSQLMGNVVHSLVRVYPDDELFREGIINERDIPSPKDEGRVAGKLRYAAAASLWPRFEKLSAAQKEAKIAELRKRAEKIKADAKTSRTSKRPISKLREQFG